MLLHAQVAVAPCPLLCGADARYPRPGILRPEQRSNQPGPCAEYDPQRSDDK